MPPLDYVGAAREAARACGAGLVDDEDEYADMPPLDYSISARLSAQDDEDLPPLEYIGPGAEIPCGPGLVEGSRVVLQGLTDTKMNGRHGTLADFDRAKDGRLPVRLDEAGQTVLVRAANIERLGPRTQEAQADAFPLSVGDIVVLKGLQTANLNGERAEVVVAPKAEAVPDDRVPLRLLKGSKTLIIKRSNLEKVASGAPANGSQLAPADPRAEVLLERMRRALLPEASPAEVAEAVTHMDAAKSVEWGPNLQKKKLMLKKLRARRRKLDATAAGAPQASGADKEGKSSSRSESEWVCLDAASRGGAQAPAASAAAAAPEQAVASRAPLASMQSMLAAGDAIGAQAGPVSIASWCQEHQLPEELVQRLADEEVMEPQELTAIPEEDLTQLTVGWKMGPKARFLKAVQRMKAVEQSERGSAYCPSDAGAGDWRQRAPGRGM
mmetsp:Transcript_62240/g.180498  ORF Transcript_62240/g.180498 Transcript_62240/m.180498 type:complete len:441 (-) Transcript_62240:79-1401(-)